MRICEGLGRLAHFAGQCMGDLELNHVHMVTRADGRRVVLKRRRWYTPVVTAMGNLYIRLFRLHIRVLQNHEWLLRERAAFHHLYGEEVNVVDGGWLEMPWLGEALSLLLADAGCSVPMKMQGLGAAARELYRIHNIRIEREGELFSHADAGARNVTYSVESGRAYWFDFEMVHRPGRSAEWRHADDLRALLFTGPGSLPEHLLDEAMDVVLDAYPDAPVWRQLRRRITGGHLDLDTYHLAQTQLPAGIHKQVAARLLNQLDKRLEGDEKP